MHCSAATILIVVATTVAPALAAPFPQQVQIHADINNLLTTTLRNGDAYGLVQRDVHEPSLWERALEVFGLYARERNGGNRPTPDPTFPHPPSGGHHRYTRRTTADLQARVDEALQLFARGTHSGKGPEPDPTFPSPHGQHGGHHARADDEELLSRFDEDEELLTRALDDEELFARIDDEDLFARFDDEDLLARSDDGDLFARFDYGLDIEGLD